MGLFGPSAAELAQKVRQEAWATIDDVNRENETLREQLDAALTSIDSLERVLKMNSESLHSYSRTVDELKDKVRKGPIADAVYAEFERMRAAGEIDFMADEAVRAKVLKEATERAVQSTADEILAKRENEYRAAISPAELAQIKADWHEVFTHDGTYDDIADSVRAEVDKQLQMELVAEAEADINEEFATDNYRQERKKLLEQAPDYKKHRKQLRADMEANHDVKMKAVLLEEEGRLTQAELDNKGAQEIAQVAELLRSRKPNEQVSTAQREALEIFSQNLMTLMAYDTHQMPKELIYERIISRFTTTGIDTVRFLPGMEITLRLGYIWSKENGYGSRSRSMRLRVEGDGKLVVVGDTNNGGRESFKYEAGQVVQIGSALIVNKKVSLQNVLIKDCRLAIEVDKKIDATNYMVDSIEINGVSSKDKPEKHRGKLVTSADMPVASKALARALADGVAGQNTHGDD